MHLATRQAHTHVVVSGTSKTTTTKAQPGCVSFLVRPVSVESPVVDMLMHGEHAGALILAPRADGDPDGPGFGAFAWCFMELKECHQGRGRGTRCTARPSSGSASPQGGRPTPLPEVAGWQDKVVRHVMEDPSSVCPFVQILDLPVPQMVGDVTDTLRILDFPIAEQVIEVPKISCSPCPSRSLAPEPQSAKQLVEVPTVLSPTRIALPIAEQTVDTPVPRGLVQGFLPVQSSTATPSSKKRISERTVEQIVDIPSSGGGLGQGSSSSAGPADEDFTVVFRTFPRGKKCGVRSRPESERARQCQLVDSGGS